jgi:protein gp37
VATSAVEERVSIGYRMKLERNWKTEYSALQGTSNIQRVFAVMNNARQHVFQVLTKRPERLEEINELVEWTKNIWLGVTAENSKHTSRIELLRKTAAYTKFISYEPLLDSVGFVDMSGIDWAIVGGESGPKSRPIRSEWIAEIKDQCERQEVLFYFKQWGGFNKKKNGREFQGKTWNAIPAFTGMV